jgi:hypothetical protein
MALSFSEKFSAGAVPFLPPRSTRSRGAFDRLPVRVFMFISLMT